MSKRWKRWWRYSRALSVPILLWALVAVTLWEPIKAWLESSKAYDEEILTEWILEGRGFRDTLPTMVKRYILKKKQEDPLALYERQKIEEHLRSVGELITHMHSNQLPLFPTIYRMEVIFDEENGPNNITWASHLDQSQDMPRELQVDLTGSAKIHVHYQLHAFDKRQREKELRAIRARNLSLLAVLATGLALGWVIYAQGRERERERQRLLTQQEMEEKKRLLLQEELRRQEAERQKEEAERDLLQQRLAAQTSERELLEVKSQLLASIGIMAGSYAHNIKNLLVRPNDLLQRCLEGNSIPDEKAKMLGEVKETLGTVTERLQQILRTVRRDPSQSELSDLNLSELLRELERTWQQMAEKWQLSFHLELKDEPLIVQGDHSHLQQAIENLLFNARDAIFEMRNRRREEARTGNAENPTARQKAILEAVGWKGNVWIRGWKENDEIVIEVQDDGSGMTEEVRERCLETHFSTKRNDAMFEGQASGMGLGLSFVQVIFDHHSAKLEIDSAPMKGATFRVRFPIEA